MPDDAPPRAAREATRQSLSVTPLGGGAMTIAPRNMQELVEFADAMSRSGECIPKMFRGNLGACLALSMQAFRWGADPFAVANKAFVVNDRVSYESQLVHAVVNSSAVLAKRLRPAFEDDGPKRRCVITGWLRGEDEPFIYTSPPVGDIPIKNSPLWKNDPDQQLFYYASRAWARRYCPEVLLGISTPDDTAMGEVIDVTPVSGLMQEAAPQRDDEPWIVCDETGAEYEFQTASTAADALDKMLHRLGNSQASLTTAWENNRGLLVDFRVGGFDAAADDLERIYRGLLPADPAATAKSGSRPPPPLASDATMGAQDAATPVQQSPPTVQTPLRHDPFWDRPTLAIDPMPLRGSGTLKPDWKGWAAMLLPKIRAAWSTPLLNQLWSENGDSLDRYGEALGQRAKDEMMAEFDEARMRLGGSGQ